MRNSHIAHRVGECMCVCVEMEKQNIHTPPSRRPSQAASNDSNLRWSCCECWIFFQLLLQPTHFSPHRARAAPSSCRRAAVKVLLAITTTGIINIITLNVWLCMCLDRLQQLLDNNNNCATFRTWISIAVVSRVKDAAATCSLGALHSSIQFNFSSGRESRLDYGQ